MARRKSRATKKTQVKNKAAMNTEKSVDVSEPENYTEKLNKCEHDSTDVLNYTQTLLAAIDRVDIPENFYWWPDLKEQQKELLGPFNRSELSFPLRLRVEKKTGEPEYEIDFQNFPLMMLEKNKSSEWVEQNDPMQVYIGVSGCGKTYEIFKNALSGYVLYSTAGTSREKDYFYENLKNDLVISSSATNDSIIVKHRRGVLIMLKWLCVKLACLVHLLKVKKDLTPLQFLYSQTNSRSNYYSACYKSVQTALKDISFSGAVNLHNNLVRYLNGKNLGYAFDEANTLHQEANIDMFMNSSGKPRSALVGMKWMLGLIITNYKYVAFAGTSMTLKHGEVLSSNVGKPHTGVRAHIKFDVHTIESSWKAFSDVVDCSECDQVKSDSYIMGLTCGRPRLNSLPIYYLPKYTNTQGTKAEHLQKAIQESFKEHIKSGLEQIRTKAEDDNNFELLVNSLEMIAIRLCAFDQRVACKHPESSEYVDKKKIKYPDLVASGICYLRQDQGEYYQCVEEVLAKQLIYSLLDLNKNIMQSDILKLVVSQFISKATKDGPLFELLVSTALSMEDTFQKIVKKLPIYNNKGEIIQVDQRQWVIDFQMKPLHKVEDGLKAVAVIQNMISYTNGTIQEESIHPDNHHGADVITFGKNQNQNAVFMAVKCNTSDTAYRNTYFNNLQLNPRYYYCNGRKQTAKDSQDLHVNSINMRKPTNWDQSKFHIFSSKEEIKRYFEKNVDKSKKSKNEIQKHQEWIRQFEDKFVEEDMWIQSVDHQSQFLQEYNKLTNVLLVGLVVPNHDYEKAPFPYHMLKDNEYFMKIESENFGDLFEADQVMKNAVLEYVQSKHTKIVEFQSNAFPINTSIKQRLSKNARSDVDMNDDADAVDDEDADHNDANDRFKVRVNEEGHFVFLNRQGEVLLPTHTTKQSLIIKMRDEKEGEYIMFRKDSTKDQNLKTCKEEIEKRIGVQSDFIMTDEEYNRYTSLEDVVGNVSTIRLFENKDTYNNIVGGGGQSEGAVQQTPEQKNAYEEMRKLTRDELRVWLEKNWLAEEQDNNLQEVVNKLYEENLNGRTFAALNKSDLGKNGLDFKFGYIKEIELFFLKKFGRKISQ